MTAYISKMPSPSAETISELESWLGQKLPAAYIDFVRDHDGAEPQENVLVTSYNEVAVSRFIPVKEAPELGEQIDGFPSGVIPFAEDNCGNYFYVEPRSGSVCFWDHEIEGQDEVVASDVPGFVAKLTPCDMTKVKLAPSQVKRVWVNPSFKPEF
ncbi:SMI1/KNR4 family protein [Novosphingobium jiangmenense]|uniref:SMI1/KNR4 family protein n=1 Tax=Novosphingobium jiangmenense TaxID=2791981 RepID=A0ABS0HKT3_9SPHN|nr:SMI1/KNR4 family protein [Novosphingobium jiangmenense]MBF9152851.1 SMI1/KNR4 family protein [Novosphingobium jiangmenense]